MTGGSTRSISLVATFDALATGLGFGMRERHALARGRRDAESAALDDIDAAEPRALDADFRARARRLRAVLSWPPKSRRPIPSCGESPPTARGSPPPSAT